MNEHNILVYLSLGLLLAGFWHIGFVALGLIVTVIAVWTRPDPLLDDYIEEKRKERDNKDRNVQVHED